MPTQHVIDPLSPQEEKTAVEFGDPINKKVKFVLNDKIAKRVGFDDRITDLTDLGHGQMGIAYWIPEIDRVLKITTDKTEALSSLALLKSKFAPHHTLVTIFDVFRFDTESGAELFGIVQERLEKPAYDWSNFATLWYKFRRDTNFETMITEENIDVFRTWMREDQFMDLEEYEDQLEWLHQVAVDLALAGIMFRDLHKNNIMRRKDNQHVIIDLGMSMPPSNDVNRIPSVDAKFIELLESAAAKIELVC